jgi:hypothetical protein
VAIEEVAQRSRRLFTGTNVTAQRLKKVGIGLPETFLQRLGLVCQSSQVTSPLRIAAVQLQQLIHLVDGVQGDRPGGEIPFGIESGIACKSCESRLENVWTMPGRQQCLPPSLG